MDQDRWRSLCRRLGCASADERLSVLEAAHAEKHRHYHDARHVGECLSLFDSLRGICEHPDEVEFAIWLHDAVYEPRRGDNEERSAELAARWLEGCDVVPASGTRVRNLILTTRHTGMPETKDEQVLVDVDLHILGSARDRFDEYEEQVRAEYRWVPGPIFRRRRAGILSGFLARSTIYHTDACRSRFEERARSNLARSLERLTG